MTVTIPQRELRNHAGEVLRRAERGERFTITVDGRAVAELGPLPGARAPATPESFARILEQTPVDREWSRELLEQRAADEAATSDPWRP